LAGNAQLEPPWPRQHAAQMTEDVSEPYSLLCSACYTPCSGSDAHVIPRWNSIVRSVLTTYRCSECWRGSLAELRSLVVSGDREVMASFLDFVSRHSYAVVGEVARADGFAEQQAYLLGFLDALEEQRVILRP
jgi:hypothetical protein